MAVDAGGQVNLMTDRGLILAVDAAIARLDRAVQDNRLEDVALSCGRLTNLFAEAGVTPDAEMRALAARAQAAVAGALAGLATAAPVVSGAAQSAYRRAGEMRA